MTLTISRNFISHQDGKSRANTQSNQWQKKTQTLFFIDERVAMMNYQKKSHDVISRSFRWIFSRKWLKINARVVNIVKCVGCVKQERRDALLLSILEWLKNKSRLYLFIIRDAYVIKYLCLSFSRLVHDSALPPSIVASNFALRLCDKSRAQWM